MSLSKDITEMIGDSARYLLILFAESEIDKIEEEKVEPETKISLTKKEILYITVLSILGMALVYYALYLNYKLLPFHLLLLLSITAGLLVAFLSHEIIRKIRNEQHNNKLHITNYI